VPTEPARNGRADEQLRTNPTEGRSAASRGSLVDGHVGRYAARAKDMAASEIRALFAVASRPEIVSLAGGMPCVTALPLDVMGDMTGQLVARRGAAALQYGSAQGDPALREGLATARRGVIRYQRTSVRISVVKLREWAAREGVHYQTAWRWWRDGKLPVSARQTSTGTILVKVPAAGSGATGVVVYARGVLV
jgi:hypothetical protein